VPSRKPCFALAFQLPVQLSRELQHTRIESTGQKSGRRRADHASEVGGVQSHYGSGDPKARIVRHFERTAALSVAPI
jgi:hypothetical protein